MRGQLGMQAGYAETIDADPLYCAFQSILTLLILIPLLIPVDIEQCPHCGGQLKLIAAIEEPAAIARILTHLGLAAQPPPRAPAVRLDLFQAA